MELIERVARAICKAQFGHLRGYEGRETSYHRLAKAAIRAMLDGVEPDLYARDLDGTGSLHVCADGDPSA